MSGMASYTPGMEISGGSLGHGLTVAVGMALGLRHLGSDSRVINFLSDGELNEGSTWEAAMSAASHRLGNLIALVDMNALQADGPTAGVLSIEPVEQKWASFGWRTQRVNGNDPEALLRAFDAIDERERRRRAARHRLRHEGRPWRATPRDAREVPLHAHRRTRMGDLSRSSSSKDTTRMPRPQRRAMQR